MESVVSKVVKEEIAAAEHSNILMKDLLRKSQLKQMEHLKEASDPVMLPHV